MESIHCLSVHGSDVKISLWNISDELISIFGVTALVSFAAILTERMVNLTRISWKHLKVVVILQIPISLWHISNELFRIFGVTIEHLENI